MEETLWNGMRLAYDAACFPPGTDSILLAQFASLPPRARIADLGAGCGTLGVLLCARMTDCTVTGVELDPAAYRFAQKNIEKNALHDRFCAMQGDVREIRSLLPAGGFSCVVSNPPYFPVGSGKTGARAALRSEETLPLDALCRAAAWLLPDGGRFSLVHRPERLCDLFCYLRENALEPKRLCFVRHSAAAPASLVLLEARRGGKSGLRYEPDFVCFRDDGSETPAYRAAYHRDLESSFR